MPDGTRGRPTQFQPADLVELMALVTETQLVSIDNQLRLILFGLECALDVEFPVDVVEKIFSDCEEDAVSE